MNLEDIGFYTLSDARVRQVSTTSPLWRCELILTDRCNFKCPYCRGVLKGFRGDMSYDDAMYTLSNWCDHDLKNVRFSGGEPTLWKYLENLVYYATINGVERVAISTNGSAPFNQYYELVHAGVNDFSISLDACCSSTGKTMSGGIDVWKRVIANIESLSEMTYVSVGIVLTDTNVSEVVDTVRLADKLGVADIRIISAAQENKLIYGLSKIEQEILDRHPILKYRVGNYLALRNVRGIKSVDSHSCYLMLDDMAVLSGYHFPCIIYMREGGDPVGKVGLTMRQDRLEWIRTHDTHKDNICSKNCLDVCVAYNNKARDIGEEAQSLVA